MPRESRAIPKEKRKIDLDYTRVAVKSESQLLNSLQTEIDIRSRAEVDNIVSGGVPNERMEMAAEEFGKEIARYKRQGIDISVSEMKGYASEIAERWGQVGAPGGIGVKSYLRARLRKKHPEQWASYEAKAKETSAELAKLRKRGMSQEKAMLTLARRETRAKKREMHERMLEIARKRPAQKPEVVKKPPKVEKEKPAAVAKAPEAKKKPEAAKPGPREKRKMSADAERLLAKLGKSLKTKGGTPVAPEKKAGGLSAKEFEAQLKAAEKAGEKKKAGPAKAESEAIEISKLSTRRGGAEVKTEGAIEERKISGRKVARKARLPEREADVVRWSREEREILANGTKAQKRKLRDAYQSALNTEKRKLEHWESASGRRAKAEREMIQKSITAYEKAIGEINKSMEKG